MSLKSWKRALGVGLLCASLLPVHAYAQDQAPLTAQNNVSFYQLETKQPFVKSAIPATAVANAPSEAMEAQQQLAIIFSPAFSVYSPEEQLTAYTQFYENEVKTLKTLKQNLHTAMSEADLNAYQKQIETSAIQLRNSYSELLKSLQLYIDTGADVTSHATNLLSFIQEERALINELTSVVEIKKGLVGKMTKGSNSAEPTASEHVEALLADDFVMHENKAYVSVTALAKFSTLTVDGEGGDWRISTPSRTLNKKSAQFTLNGTAIGSPAMSHKVDENYYVQFDMLLSLLALTFEEKEEGIVIKEKLSTNQAIDAIDVETFIKTLKK